MDGWDMTTRHVEEQRVCAHWFQTTRSITPLLLAVLLVILHYLLPSREDRPSVPLLSHCLFSGVFWAGVISNGWMRYWKVFFFVRRHRVCFVFSMSYGVWACERSLVTLHKNRLCAEPRPERQTRYWITGYRGGVPSTHSVPFRANSVLANINMTAFHI